MLEKHTTWLAYLWAVVASITSYFANWTINDWAALVGIALGVGTFWVNRYYKKKQAVLTEKRNQILEQILREHSPESTIGMLARAELQDDDNGDNDES